MSRAAASRCLPDEFVPRFSAAFALALFALALLPRLYVAIEWTGEPAWDGTYYDLGARRIAAGLGYSDDIVIGGVPVWHPWCHYPVGYPGLLGLVYWLVGHGRLVGPALNALVGAALAVATYGLARHVTTERRARIAGILTALYPGLIAYTALLMTEPVAALAIVAAAWAAAAQPGLRGAVLAGVLLGLGTLVRPQSIVLAPALGLFALRHGPAKSSLRPALTTGAVATAAALAVVAPWTIRNCRVMDGCAFVSTNAGWNLAIGAFPRATGRFETLRSGDGCHIVTGQVQQDRCWVKLGGQWIAADLERWLRFMPRKLAYTFDHESSPIGYLSQSDPAAWPPERQHRGRWILSWTHHLLLCVAALGVLAWPRRGRGRIAQLGALATVGIVVAHSVSVPEHPVWPLALLVPLFALARLPQAPRNDGAVGYAAFTLATLCATHAVFFGEDRYHMVVVPLLCVLAACALRRPAEPSRAEEPPPPTC